MMSGRWLDRIDRLGEKSSYWLSKPPRERALRAAVLAVAQALILGIYAALFARLTGSLLAPVVSAVFLWTCLVAYLVTLVIRPEAAWRLFIRSLLVAALVMLAAYGVFVAVLLASR
jgi:hypothetical protein